MSHTVTDTASRNLIRPTHRETVATSAIVFSREPSTLATLPKATEAITTSLPTTLPSLTELLVATSKRQRSELLKRLRVFGEGLSSSDHDEAANERIIRARVLLNSSEIPREVPPLSTEEQRELAQALHERRHSFWTKLYQIPFIQREAIRTLESIETKEGKASTLIFPPRTEEYRKADKTQRNIMLVAAARDALHQIRRLGETYNDGLQSDYRKNLAAILVTAPLPPEQALTLAAEARRKHTALVDEEIKCAAGALSETYNELVADLGASALQVRAFLSDLSHLEVPYTRIKNYMVMSLANMAQSEINRRIRSGAPQKEDLLQSSIVGIMSGVERFDPGYGTMISTNTFNWINRALRAERSASALLVSMPSQKQSEFFKFRALSETAGESRKIVEIAILHGASTDDALAFASLVAPPRSLDYTSSTTDGGSGRAFSELVADRKTIEVDTIFDETELREHVGAALQILNSTQQRIVSLFFGLGGIQPMTDAEIGTHLGIGTGRVKRLLHQSLSQLARHLYAERVHERYASR